MKPQISNFKLTGLIAFIVLVASCAKTPSIEERLASTDSSVVKSALGDMWRGNDAQNIAAAAILLDSQGLAEDAALALNLLNSGTADTIASSGLAAGRDNYGRLLYLYFASKERTPDKKTTDFIAANHKNLGPALLPGLMILAQDSPAALAKAAAAFERMDMNKYPAAAREFILLAGEKGGMGLYPFLSRAGKKYPRLKPFTAWAMRRIKPADKITRDKNDRVISKNPYWKKDPGNPVMPSVQGTFKSWHTANPDILVRNNIIYFYYRGGNGTDRIALATVPYGIFNGKNFLDWTNNPIIGPDKGDFDSRACLDPAAVYFKDRVFLYYSALGKGDDSVGLAVSKDFYNFEKYGKNPVLKGRAPDIAEKDGLLYMIYVLYNETGGYSIHLATSRDGYNFVKYGSGPVFAVDPSEGAWDAKSVTTPRLFEKDGVYYMIYAGDDKYLDYPPYFGLAFSYDLVHWYRSTQNPVFSRGAKGAFDDGGIWFAQAFEYKDKWYLYYEGWGGGDSHEKEYGPGGHSQIGVAVFDGDIADLL